MRHWWVNHSRTLTQEISGGYLWSPKTEKNGNQSQFYKNMRIASPGDLILSFAHGKIGFLGRVLEFAFAGNKPSEFGNSGISWANDGWLLPVSWERLSTAVRPKDIIEELSDFLPDKYSPINVKNGNGNQKAYLAEISSLVFNRILIEANLVLKDYEISQIMNISGSYSDILEEHIEQNIFLSPELSATERSQLINSRRGQGLFRQNVAKQELGCRITGITNPILLIASHIKPWRLCSTSHERLDGSNGLLLTPHIDLLFDRGFITFADVGALQISSRLAQPDFARLGLAQNHLNHFKAFTPSQQSYLKFHRENVFLSS
jgi:putative restriction endonuclease